MVLNLPWLKHVMFKWCEIAVLSTCGQFGAYIESQTVKWQIVIDSSGATEA